MSIVQRAETTPKPTIVAGAEPARYPNAADIQDELEISEEAWRAAHRMQGLAPCNADSKATDLSKAWQRRQRGEAYDRYRNWCEHGPDAEHLQVPERVACRLCDAPLPEVKRAAEAARARIVELWPRWQNGPQSEEEEDALADFDFSGTERLIDQAQARKARCPRCKELELQMARGKPEQITAAHRMLVDIVRQAERWQGRAPVNFLKPWTAPPFEASDVPATLARYPVLYSQQTGIDASITITGALGVAAASISDEIKVCGDRGSDWFERPCLWILHIGPSAAGKTPALDRLLVPLQQIERELLNAYEAALQLWQASQESKKSQKPELGSREDKPPRPCVITTNPTIEAEANILVANPRGILLVAKEFSTWVGAMDRYNKDGGDRAYQLSLYDGGPLSIERATEGKSRYVPNWSAGLLASTTPAEIERLSGKLGHQDGFMQRVTPVLARSRVYVEEENKPQEDLVRRARDDFYSLIQKLWRLVTPAEGAWVELSDEAQGAFAEWRKTLMTLIEGYENREPALAAHLGKYESMLLRVALTVHAVECVTSGAHPVDRKISEETFALAIRYMRRVEQHATIFHLSASASEAVQLAKNVGWYILAREENDLVLQRRELAMSVRPFKNSDDRLREAAMGLLTDYGWVISCDEGGYRKELPTRWDLNPALAETFAAEAENERKRRALVRERIAESVAERKLKKHGKAES